MKSEICAPLEFKGYIHGISTDGLPHTPHFPGVLTPPGQLVSGSVVRGVRSVLVKRACPLSSPWLALVLAVKARVACVALGSQAALAREHPTNPATLSL